ncbi:MAG: hypothetical protein EAZ85_14645 [Bacteroidetes bacterium]|nr:MAG: hypothetical protein EAZ85_14645 [Bacteroidota bacterium]TAG88505.1 MAG: hypothetical protein EAZ20_08445 [Bacteroidota bacterium]
MKLLFLTSIIFAFFSQITNAQNTYPLPKGYTQHKDMDNNLSRLEGDFDGDNKKDLMVVATKKGADEHSVFVYLSSSYNKKTPPQSFLIGSALGYSIEMKKNVVSIGACFGNGRFCKTFKFRYNKNIKDLQLIGYDEQNFGNAMHEGSYKKSVNLSTKQFEVTRYEWDDKIKKDRIILNELKKFTINNILFKDLTPQKIEELEKIGAKYLER